MKSNECLLLVRGWDQDWRKDATCVWWVWIPCGKRLAGRPECNGPIETCSPWGTWPWLVDTAYELEMGKGNGDRWVFLALVKI